MNKYSKMKKFVALTLATCMLWSMTGCSDDLNDDSAVEKIESQTTEDESPVGGTASNNTKADAQRGTGLEEIQITGFQDSNPERTITQTKAPIKQIKSKDIYGNTLADEFYMYRNMLSPTYQKAYDQLYQSFLNGNATVTMSVAVNMNDIDDVMYSICYDHPELFWIDTSISYSYNGSGVVTEATIGFNHTANDLATAKQQFEEAIMPVINKAKTLSSDIDKVKTIHDYLTYSVSYVSGSDLNQSAYSAIVNKQTVCAGYARAFQYCMQKLGIVCAYCVGYAGESHAWNIVKLDNEYYNMDVTWDDPLDNPPTTYYYDYYNITDAKIGADHTRTDMSVNLPACNGTKYQYNGTAGSDFTNLDQYENTDSGVDTEIDGIDDYLNSLDESNELLTATPMPTVAVDEYEDIIVNGNDDYSYDEFNYNNGDDYSYDSNDNSNGSSTWDDEFTYEDDDFNWNQYYNDWNQWNESDTSDDWSGWDNWETDDWYLDDSDTSDWNSYDSDTDDWDWDDEDWDTEDSDTYNSSDWNW